MPHAVATGPHHKVMVVFHECQCCSHLPVTQRPIAVQIIQIVTAFLQEHADRFLFRFSNKRRINVTAADIGKTTNVADHLATYLLKRKVNTSGQVSLGGNAYYLGTKYAGLTVQVHFNANSYEWVFADMDTKVELKRKEPKYFSVEYFTGLEPPSSRSQSAIQLSFPGLI